jgi:hypothetical protein
MWADFAIGITGIIVTKLSGGTGNSRGKFGMRVKGDVGTYMGATSGNQLVQGGFYSGIGAFNEFKVEMDNTTVGGLYHSRIASTSANSDDYEGSWVNDGTPVIDFRFSQIYTNKDEMKATEI